ncbi:MAG: hypothetical protein KME08_21280 [Aphanothece sp. CMT-3BRIN-NPC111]|jgi:hypothetical protein|nr:hypothetical protein [Aphanothece sp. CMT-3BRIN-NPC111]
MTTNEELSHHNQEHLILQQQMEQNEDTQFPPAPSFVKAPTPAQEYRDRQSGSNKTTWSCEYQKLRISLRGDREKRTFPLFPTSLTIRFVRKF